MTVQYSRAFLSNSIILVWCSLTLFVDAAPRNFRAVNPSTNRISSGVALMISLIVIAAFLLFLCRIYCPNGPEFTALELDEIRIERLQRIEDRIKENIQALKSKLSFHKQKKQKVQKERDLKVRLQSYVLGGRAGGGVGDDISDEESNSIGKRGRRRRYPDRSNLFEQESIWTSSPLRGSDSNNSTNPRKEQFTAKESTPLLAALQSQESQLIGEKEDLEEKADYGEEKEDLWNMWNTVATDKLIRNGPGNISNTPAASDSKKSYQSIKFGNKSEQKKFASSMIAEQSRKQQQQSFQDQKRTDDYNNAMMYTESQWDQKRPGASTASNTQSSAKKQDNYSINVAVKDYRSAEKYSLDVADNPLLSRQTLQHKGQATGVSAEKLSSPLLQVSSIRSGDSKPSLRATSGAVKPPPPKGPPPPHVLLKRKLEKIQTSQGSLSAENSVAWEEKDPDGPNLMLLQSKIE